MYEQVITGLMLVVAVIHLAPISGFFGADRLASLYGIEITNGTLEILMRHRAVFFGILGTFFAYAAFTPAVQSIAFAAAFASLASFFFLASSDGRAWYADGSASPQRGGDHLSDLGAERV